eukprot:2251197-Prymnesium_polylepis.1
MARMCASSGLFVSRRSALVMGKGRAYRPHGSRLSTVSGRTPSMMAVGKTMLGCTWAEKVIPGSDIGRRVDVG